MGIFKLNRQQKTHGKSLRKNHLFKGNMSSTKKFSKRFIQGWLCVCMYAWLEVFWGEVNSWTPKISSSNPVVPAEIFIFVVVISVFFLLILGSLSQTSLVGGFNPLEEYESKWESSPTRGENKKIFETTT